MKRSSIMTGEKTKERINAVRSVLGLRSENDVLEYLLDHYETSQISKQQRLIHAVNEKLKEIEKFMQEAEL